MYIFNEKMKNNIDVNIWSWLDEFLLFIKETHFEYLKNYAIIPNMNLIFVKNSNELATSENVPENMIDCLENLNINWKNQHINTNISKFKIEKEHDIDFAVSKICKCVEEWSDKVLVLIHYIPVDSEEKFKQKREMIYYLCSNIWVDKMSEKKYVKNFPEEIWNKVDPMILKRIIEKMEEFGFKRSIKFINIFLKCATEYHISYENHKIIPNKNGKFCKIGELYIDDNIPDLFKKCLKQCFNYDIKEELIDERIATYTSISKKSIISYKSILNYFFNSRNVDEFKKKMAAEYLIRIIPEKKEEEKEIYNTNEDNEIYKKDESIDDQERQIEIYNIYKFFTQSDCDSIIIKRDDNNYNCLWQFIDPYIGYEIKRIIEKEYNIDSFVQKFLNKKSIIQNLQRFIEIFQYTSGKIIFNQNGKLCDIKEVYNEGNWENGEEIKNIAFYLGYDIREKLIHKEMKISFIKNIEFKEICYKIDDIMENKFNDQKNHQDPNFKLGARYLLEYFDNIGEEKANNYFPKTFLIKEKITYNVIYDEKTRKDISTIQRLFKNDLSVLSEKSESLIEFIKNEEKYKNLQPLTELYNNDSIRKLSNPKIANLMNEILTNYDINSNKLIENQVSIKKIISAELNDSNYKSNTIIHGSSFNNPSEIEIGDKKISIAFSKFTNNEINHLTNILYPHMTYGYDFDLGGKINFENPINKRTGICGEAYIYELLKNTGKYKNVKWNMLSKNGVGEKFEFGGKVYNILNDYSDHDILVETYDGRIIYIEVKSTKYKFENNKKVPFYLSRNQINKMRNSNANEYILAIVFDIMSKPEHFFMTLRSEV